LYFEKHQKIAIGLFLFVITIIYVRDGMDLAIAGGKFLFLSLLGIIFYRFFAKCSHIGFIARFASDYSSEVKPGPYAIFFWLFFIVACVGFLFK